MRSTAKHHQNISKSMDKHSMDKHSSECLGLIMEKICDTGSPVPADVFVQQEFGRANLFLGFGEINAIVSPRTHKEVELGTFSGEWRILIDNHIYLAGRDARDEEEFNVRLHKIKFGAMKSITMLSAFDVRLTFENGIALDFLCCASDDEVFHCFLPNNQVISLEPQEGWVIEWCAKQAQ